MRRPLRIQLWSCNYDPEPTGIGPVSRVLAEGLRERGHRVEVVAAHPHYPTPSWGVRRLPYREQRNGIRVLRLPLWVGRASALERYRQELTFTGALFASLPALGRPDIVISASPSFPALLPALVNTRLRGVPWLLWLHDILPDGAAATGLVSEGRMLRVAQQLERLAYREADRIVVLSRAFTDNLCAKDVPLQKIELVYDPATREPGRAPRADVTLPLRLLSMGNIGHSQGLAPLVETFERSARLGDLNAQLIITGNGVAAGDVQRRLVSGRTRMLGVVDDEQLESELQRAAIGVVTQHYAGAEFNIPSKLMNLMAYGLPVLAVVNPEGEVARIVREADAGWVVDSADPAAFPAKVAELSESPGEVEARGRAALAYARRHFTRGGFADRFEAVAFETVALTRT